MSIGEGRARSYAGHMAKTRPQSPQERLVADRIRAIMERLEIRQTELADRLQVDQGSVSRVLGGTRKLTKEWIDRIAAALGVPAASIAYGVELSNEIIGSATKSGRNAVTNSPRGLTDNYPPEFEQTAYVQIRGEAQAGLWLPEEMAQHVPDPIPVAKVANIRGKQFAYRVRGTSMDLEGIKDGTYLICIKPDYLLNGDVVIAKRERNGEVEYSCKLFARENGRIILSPNSSDPRWQKPIVYEEGGADEDGCQVEIVGVMVGQYSIRPR